jgi:glucuronokinase
MADAATGHAPARAALAGNPSDGYGGAVLAVAVGDFGAVARAERAARDDFGGLELVAAAVRRYRRWAGVADRVAVSTRCSVPLEVGLAGSSAIVIATLRALGELHGAPVPPADLPALALAVETEELGIAAGLQDRIAQVHGGLVFMDFAFEPPRHAPLEPALLPPLFLAWRADAAAASGGFHGSLRARWESGDPAVRSGMTALGDAARAAREHLVGGDDAGFAMQVDRSYDLRASMSELDPRHVRMIEAARACGAAANYAGSGGAIAGIAPHPRVVDELRRALTAEGCVVIQPQIALQARVSRPT